MSNPGYVYILTNEYMPGLVKIGRTSRDVDLRASELWQTGVPVKFEVYASEKTCDCVQLEAYMHGDLREYRVSHSREFFTVQPDLAAQKLCEWAKVQADGLIHGNFSSFAVVQYEKWVNEQAIDRLAEAASVNPRSICDAFAEITLDELLPALDRMVRK